MDYSLRIHMLLKQLLKDECPKKNDPYGTLDELYRGALNDILHDMRIARDEAIGRFIELGRLIYKDEFDAEGWQVTLSASSLENIYHLTKEMQKYQQIHSSIAHSPSNATLSGAPHGSLSKK